MQQIASICTMIAGAALLGLAGCEQSTPAAIAAGAAAPAAEPAQLAGAAGPIRREITEILEVHWLAHFSDEDWEAFGALYTDRAWLMPPNLPRIEGREGIAEYFAGLKALFENTFGVITAEFVIREVEHYGHAAVVVSVYEIRGQGDVLADTGHLIKTFVRDGSGWLIHRSIFNSDLETPGS